MPKMIFVNLPVTDLDRSVAFYEALGMVREPRFSNAQGVMMQWSDQISFMLLTRDFFHSFVPDRQVADTRATAAAHFGLSADDRAGVDALCDAAAAAGGRVDINAPDDYGWMYGRSFEDPDGHLFAPTWMDVDAAMAADAATADA